MGSQLGLKSEFPNHGSKEVGEVATSINSPKPWVLSKYVKITGFDKVCVVAFDTKKGAGREPFVADSWVKLVKL